MHEPGPRTSSDLGAAELRAWWDNTLSREIAAEVPWRSAAVCALGAGAGILSTWDELREGGVLAALWLVLVVLLLFLHFRLLYERDLRWICSLAVFSTFVVLPCFALLPALSYGRPGISAALFPLFVMASGNIPWSWPASIAAHLLFGLAAVASAPLTSAPLLFLLAAFTALVVSFRIAALHYLSALSRASFSFLAHYCEYPQHGAAIIRVLAWQFAVLTRNRQAVVLYPDASSEIINGETVKSCSASSLIVRGFMQSLSDRRQEQGSVALEEFGPQYTAAFIEWFAVPPRRIFFVRLPAVTERAEQMIAVLLPVRTFNAVCGVQRSLRVLGAVATFARASLNALKNRQMTSDVLTLSEETSNEREREFNELVHLSNNIAQNIAAECDALRGLFAQDPAAEEALRTIEQLEGSVEVLSSSVSDSKLLRELAGLRSLPAVEEIDITQLLQQVSFFGAKYAEQHGRRYKLSQNLEWGTQAAVCGPDYLRAVLRTMVRQLTKLPQSGEIVAVAAGAENEIAIDIGCWSGASFDPPAGLRPPAADDTNRRRIAAAEPLSQLVLAAGGSLETFSDPFVFRLRLRRGTGPRVGGVNPASARWVLFIDDNPEVLTFYARVSEALHLASKTAASCDEARRLAEEQGAPGLLVTDIQLAGEQAFDLVHEMRSKFGMGFPVIIISGSSEREMAERAKQVGATCYLTKPVGRRKLFTEIQRALRHGVQHGRESARG